MTEWKWIPFKQDEELDLLFYCIEIGRKGLRYQGMYEKVREVEGFEIALRQRLSALATIYRLLDLNEEILKKSGLNEN